ncbi:MAG: ogr/Delta-like zinc finger family protein [Gammaproteobacteria bacterium]|nr:ogr/Delta-like zinc finger family protein [Gammaproteobacteria bacterium]
MSLRRHLRRIRCPECGGQTSVRTSRMLSSTCKEARHQCTACQNEFRSLTPIEIELVRVAVPKPSTLLPLAKRKRTPPATAQPHSA